MEFGELLLATARDTSRDLAVVVVILIAFQLGIVRRPLPNPRRIGIGLIYVFAGMTLFLVGLHEALFPIGRTMGLQLAERGAAADDETVDWRAYVAVYAFAGAIGFTSAMAEPALVAIARKAQETSGGAIPALGLRLAVAVGMGAGVALGTFRIVTGLPLPYFIIGGYFIIVAQMWTSPRAIVPLAFDSSVAATSIVSVPVVAALGLGLAATVPGRSPLVDGFGLIAFACVCPIMSVLAYVWLAHRLRRKPTAGGAKS